MTDKKTYTHASVAVFSALSLLVIPDPSVK